MTQLVTAEGAIAWLREELKADDDQIAQLDTYARLLEARSETQNLVARSTLGENFWVRHIVDSAQLLPLVSHPGKRWVDVGSGAGLPGIVIAILAPATEMTLIEPRRLRSSFLQECVEALGLIGRIAIRQSDVEKQVTKADVISARAVAPLADLIPKSRHLAHRDTIWLLPKGKNAVNELSTLPNRWQSTFHVERSVTDSEAHILIGLGEFNESGA